MKKNKPEFDGPWKDILDIYFEQFIAYCFPSKYAEIDWNTGYSMRDKELTKATRQSKTGKKVVDKLVEIHLSNSRIRGLEQPICGGYFGSVGSDEKRRPIG
ncbi:MAG: hypothetical protein KBD03_05070 [Gammaproteobacteria bacterium]|nr:hypothetical protein [Gammaproteobacteria bacterium]